MLFNVDSDEGRRLTGYVVPDGGGTTASVAVRSGGKEVLRLEASNVLQGLVDAGRHSTGRCGFVIDETHLPDLATYHDLEIVEPMQDMLVYRRRPPAALDAKIFRLETHLLPLWRIDEAVKSRFQFWYKGIDRFGRETANQVFDINGTSCYASGRLLYKNYEFYLAKGVSTVGVLRDPYCELAERLILLKNIGSRAQEILGERDALIYAPVVESLAEWDKFDETFCKRFLRRASPEVAVILSNPLVRQLTGSTPDEMPNQAAIATALDYLASFELLGLRSDANGFCTGFAELLGVEAAGLPPINEYPRIIELGARLRQNHDIEAILEKDLEVFHTLTSALEAANA